MITSFGLGVAHSNLAACYASGGMFKDFRATMSFHPKELGHTVPLLRNPVKMNNEFTLKAGYCLSPLSGTNGA